MILRMLILRSLGCICVRLDGAVGKSLMVTSRTSYRGRDRVVVRALDSRLKAGLASCLTDMVCHDLRQE